MAATMGIFEVNGSSYTPGSTGTDKSAGNIAFRANDSNLTDAANPVVRPASSTTQSFQKWLHMRASGTFTSISNPKFYTSSSAPSTGVTFYAKTVNTNTFAQPTAPADNTAGTDLATFTQGSPKSLSTVAAGPWTGIGDIGDFLIVWASVASTASAGSMGSSVFVFSWDEV